MQQKVFRFVKIFVLSALFIGAAGCWNGDVTNTSLGDVSVGQQLIDLKTAYEQGALNEAEYEQARQKFLSLLDGCDCNDEDSDEDGDDESTAEMEAE